MRIPRGHRGSLAGAVILPFRRAYLGPSALGDRRPIVWRRGARNSRLRLLRCCSVWALTGATLLGLGSSDECTRAAGERCPQCRFGVAGSRDLGTRFGSVGCFGRVPQAFGSEDEPVGGEEWVVRW